MILEQLDNLYQKALVTVKSAQDLKHLDDLRVALLGRKGELTKVLHSLKSLTPEERPQVGQRANEIKEKLTSLLEQQIETLKKQQWMADRHLQPDPTLPGRPSATGHLHILNQTLDEIKAIFTSMGFATVEGPEVESDYYNFEAMNFPPDHPSRDEHDTFFITDKILLRTHTSPVQVRLMEKSTPPIRAIMPGKTYRCDDDASHSPMFHQVEGLLIDETVSFADLKSVLTQFVKAMFGEKLSLRFRPGFFPFTEPSAEVDMSCVNCGGKGCTLCKGTGWMEILGAGMVHPNVLKAGGIDPERYNGFAFGMGVERITILKYGIDHMRYFFENDLRFLEQF